VAVLSVRLDYRRPFDHGLLGFVAARCVPGIEEVDGRTYRRSLALPHGGGIVELTPREGHVDCVLTLDDASDAATAVAGCRSLLDLDADPVAVAAHFGQDPDLAPLVRRAPGRRVPGTTDPF
jgi:AraC family transcriptional regulator of adaptative response / DNA-3-methyladenine glycosylase II